MRKTKLLLGVIVALVTAFIGFKIFQQEIIAEYIRPVILPLLTVYYCVRYKDSYSYFFYFLLFYSLSELFSISYFFLEPTYLMDDIIYFTGNSLCVFAYVFLIFEIFKSLNVIKVFKRFFLLILLLVSLDVYTIILVSNVAEKSEFIITVYEYSMEVIYNSAIMLLLTVALLNYLYRDSNKGMTLLVGSLCIVFSEVIQVAYFYVTEISFLDILYSVLMVLAFRFFNMQANMEYGEDYLTRKNTIKELEEA